MGLLIKLADYRPPEEFRLQDKIYLAIICPVMAAALLEWFLWIAAFLYCLWKVYAKAGHWSVKILAVTMAILFTALRGIFLPVMVVTLPLPYAITRTFPPRLVWFLQWFAFWTFAALLIIPWLVCVYRLVTNSLGRKKRIKQILDVRSAPKTVIVMPVYKEEPPVLIKAIDSVVDCDYPTECIHVFLSFDGDQVDELYLKMVEHLGVPINLKSYPQSIDVTYKSSRITISRFKHGGKRNCQRQTFRLIDKVYENYLKRNDDLFLLFIDSDCILDRFCLQNFMWDMELKPGLKRKMLAMTGVITATTQKTSLITLLQDMEYIHGQLFERSVESGCGAVTCLPGALTILRFSAFRKMAKYYFADKAGQCTDLFDFGKCHLGEDRWLTHLFMIGARQRYQIQMCTSAFCKTEAVQTFSSLLKQRRRWFLGFITNEVCMLTDIRLWRLYPILCLVRLMQNTIRTTALLFFIMVISIITTSNRVENLPVGFIAVSLGLNYLLMFYFGLKLRRYKAWLYPVMFILNPFFNWLYMVYGIFTAGQRTWGGPRADAAAADPNTTPAQAAEQAEEQGDELNVNLETFPTVQEAQEAVLVRPSKGIEGRFALPEMNFEGYYNNENLSGLSLPTHFVRNPDILPFPLHPRDSFDSRPTNTSVASSICLPRRVESIMAEEDAQDQVFITPEDQQKMNLARQARPSNAAIEGIPFDSVSDLEKDSISRLQSTHGTERQPNAQEFPSASSPYNRPAFHRARRPRVGRSPLRKSSAPEPDGDDYATNSPLESPTPVEAETEASPRPQESPRAASEPDAEPESGRHRERRRRLTKELSGPHDMV